MHFSLMVNTLPQLSLTLGAASTSASDSLMWYVTRTAAISSYIVLTILVSLGLLQSYARRAGARISWVVDEAHQWLGTIFAALTLLHLLSLLLDPYISFTWLNLIVPTEETYRPLAVAFGVLALWTMVIVLGSSWLRRHLPQRFWRAFHYLSFATFALVTVHGILAGSDTGQPWMYVVYIAAGALVGLLTIMRLFPQTSGARVPAQSNAK